MRKKYGCVRGECGRTVTEDEYDCGVSACCEDNVVPEEEFGGDPDPYPLDDSEEP